MQEPSKNRLDVMLISRSGRCPYLAMEVPSSQRARVITVESLRIVWVCSFVAPYVTKDKNYIRSGDRID